MKSRFNISSSWCLSKENLIYLPFKLSNVKIILLSWAKESLTHLWSEYTSENQNIWTHAHSHMPGIIVEETWLEIMTFACHKIEIWIRCMTSAWFYSPAFSGSSQPCSLYLQSIVSLHYTSVVLPGFCNPGPHTLCHGRAMDIGKRIVNR